MPVPRANLPGLEEQFLINIDHHVSGQPFAHINWIDPSACATAELIYRLARAAIETERRLGEFVRSAARGAEAGRVGRQRPRVAVRIDGNNACLHLELHVVAAPDLRLPGRAAMNCVPFHPRAVQVIV